jgi:transposase
MDVLYERCCGLDIHKRTVVACLVEPGVGRERPRKEIRTFGTMTHELLLLADWLEAHAVTHVAMESTGVYWKPVHNLLEERFELLLVNAQHIKAVPARKTDVRDCEWIADLLRHGLLRASFVPVRAQREFRELVRHRSSLVRERTAAANRLQKTLEAANIKLASVASDILGKSGRAMLEALIRGETDPSAIDSTRGDSCGPKFRRWSGHLLGRSGHTSASCWRSNLRTWTSWTQRSSALELKLPYVSNRWRRLWNGCRQFRVSDAAQLKSSWRRLALMWSGFPLRLTWLRGPRCALPIARVAASSGAMRRGNPWLRSALVEAAHAAARSKNTYLATQYRRLASRRGPKKAAVAVAHSIIVIIYQLLARQSAYAELGTSYLENRDRRASEQRLVHRLEQLGYTVHLERSVA